MSVFVHGADGTERELLLWCEGLQEVLEGLNSLVGCGGSSRCGNGGCRESLSIGQEALELADGALFEAFCVFFAVLPVIEGKTGVGGDGVLAGCYAQTLPAAGEIIVLVVRSVVHHAGEFLRVDEGSRGWGKKFSPADGLGCTGAQSQSQNEYGKDFLHTRAYIPQLHVSVKQIMVRVEIHCEGARRKAVDYKSDELCNFCFTLSTYCA